MSKWENRLVPQKSAQGGFSRAVGILVVLVALLAAMAVVPMGMRYQKRSAVFNCSLSVAKMQDMVDIEVLHRGGGMTVKEVRELLADYEARGEILCPTGGEFEVEDKGDLTKKVFCCLHDSDGVKRVTYSARRCLDRVRKAVQIAQITGTPFPKSVRVTLNGRKLEAKLVHQPTGLRRGTATTAGFHGTVAFYALAEESTDGEDTAEESRNGENGESTDRISSDGSSDSASVNSADNGDMNGADSASVNSADNGDMNGADSAGVNSADSEDADSGDSVSSDSFLPDGTVQEGEIWYFSYADEDHAATWTAGGGWRIDRK